jgi:putative SOS response-associated peptidase YedK
MPVILGPSDYDLWLDLSVREEDLQQLLRPFPSDQMETYPVSLMVNNSRNDDPACFEPLRE